MWLESCRVTEATDAPGDEAMIIGLEGLPEVNVDVTSNPENCSTQFQD